MVFFSICIAAITVVLLWGRRNGGIHQIDTFSDALAFRYVPAAIGAITVIWWRNIVGNYSRITPYILMAAKQATRDEYGSKNRRGQRTLNAFYDVLFQINFFNPIALISNGHWLLFTNAIVLWIVGVFLVGLKAAFIQTTPTANGWSIEVSDDIGYALISVYGLLIAMTMAILIRSYNRVTGLKWDPVSIADQLALLQSPHVRALFANLETCPYAEYGPTLKTRALDFGVLRLGYWKNRLDGAIWHGIAFAPKPKGSLHTVRSFRSPRLHILTVQNKLKGTGLRLGVRLPARITLLEVALLVLNATGTRAMGLNRLLLRLRHIPQVVILYSSFWTRLLFILIQNSQ